MPTSIFAPIVVGTGTSTDPIVVTAEPTSPELPRNFTPKPEERYISFIIELKNSATYRDIQNLAIAINQKLCTELSGYFPELLFSTRGIFGAHRAWIREKKPPKNIYLKKAGIKVLFDNLKLKKFPRLPFKLERLFPGSENDFKGAKKFKLDRFLLLTLPIYERQFERRTTENQLAARLFEASYKLREIPAILNVSPSSVYKGYRLLSSMGGEENDLPKNWMLDNMKAVDLPSGISGDGVTIGHPDSGWTPHSELNFTNVSTDPTSPSFDLENDWNVLNDTDTAEESLSSDAPFHFHGTSTSSVIISSGDRNSEDELTGIAPGAKILPIRTIAEHRFDPGVALIADTDVARAVWHAIRQNVDVISLSLGGYPAPELESVIAHAVYNDIIVVAAAGQYYPFLVYPAGYPECIAVGASNDGDEPWFFCVKHSKIAISAPGEKVWSAYWDDSEPNRREILDGKGNGCSFATAYVAGAAALWLERYDKQDLIDGLDGRATLQELFLQHIKETARIPGDWKTDESGAGIIDIESLLDTATLPDFGSIPGRSWIDWTRMTAIEILYLFYENTDPAVVRERLESLFGSSDMDSLMENFGQEIVNTFMAVNDVAEKFGAATEAAANDIEEAIEDVVEEAKDFISDPVGTVAGWFGG
jgi:subtilisin family serine protease